MNTNRAIISVGSNIEPMQHILKAKEILTKDVIILKETPWVQTEPIGYKNQAPFLNGAFLVSTALTRDALQKFLKDIEVSLGRPKGGFRYGPRTIDLDILLWNGCVVDSDVYERDFLQTFVKQLCPDTQG